MYERLENLIKKLDNVSLNQSIIKHIRTLIENVGLDRFFTNENYSNEKYTLFAWLITRYEPQLTALFANFDLLSMDLKARRELQIHGIHQKLLMLPSLIAFFFKDVCDGLKMIGLVCNEVPVEKLFNLTKSDSYNKLEVMVLCELIQLASMKTNSFVNINDTIDPVFESTFTLDTQCQQFPVDEFLQSHWFFKEFNSYMQSCSNSMGKSRLPIDIVQTIRTKIGDFTAESTVEQQIILIQKTYSQLEDALKARSSSNKLEKSQSSDQTTLNTFLLEEPTIDMNIDMLLKKMDEIKLALFEFNMATKRITHDVLVLNNEWHSELSRTLEAFMLVYRKYENLQNTYNSISKSINEQYKIQQDLLGSDEFMSIKKLFLNSSPIQCQKIDEKLSNCITLLK